MKISLWQTINILHDSLSHWLHFVYKYWIETNIRYNRANIFWKTIFCTIHVHTQTLSNQCRDSFSSQQIFYPCIYMSRRTPQILVPKTKLSTQHYHNYNDRRCYPIPSLSSTFLDKDTRLIDMQENQFSQAKMIALTNNRAHREIFLSTDLIECVPIRVTCSWTVDIHRIAQ